MGFDCGGKWFILLSPELSVEVNYFVTLLVFRIDCDFVVINPPLNLCLTTQHSIPVVFLENQLALKRKRNVPQQTILHRWSELEKKKN